MLSVAESLAQISLNPELSVRLAQLLPLELRGQLSVADDLSAPQHQVIHIHLRRLWCAMSAMVPRWVVDMIATPGAQQAHSVDGMLLYADLAGFTALTARLQRQGRGGNERMTEAINRFFTATVPIALDQGGDLLAFGGDALLVAFVEGEHAAAAAGAAWGMQQAVAALAGRPEGGDRWRSGPSHLLVPGPRGSGEGGTPPPPCPRCTATTLRSAQGIGGQRASGPTAAAGTSPSAC
jgi:hypothetical protein